MDAQFSESTYSFALTHEIINCSDNPVSTVPNFPSLKEEGRIGGFDVSVEISGTPLFIQFKLSEYMITKNAAEWNSHNGRYYRFNIYPESVSRQHGLLLGLQNEYPNVFYAAPVFYKIEELNEYFVSKTIFENSIFVRPIDIGVITDGKKHRVTYTEPSQTGVLYSKPRKINMYTKKDLISSISDDSKDKVLAAEEDYKKMKCELLEIANEEGIIDKDKAKEVLSYLESANLSVLKQIATISRMFFECEFY